MLIGSLSSLALQLTESVGNNNAAEISEIVFSASFLAATWVFQFQRIGFSYERIVAYYLGGEMQGQIFFPKNLNVLLEETHFHTFMMSVVFLVLSHLFLATSLARRPKLFFIVVTFFSHALNVASPWLIRIHSPLFAYGLMAAWVGLWIGYLGMIGVPLYEMWLGLGLNKE